VPGCQKLQMTGLTRSGTGLFIAALYPYDNSGCQRVKYRLCIIHRFVAECNLSVVIAIRNLSRKCNVDLTIHSNYA